MKAQSDLPPEAAACNQNAFGSLELNWNDYKVYSSSSIDFEESSLSLEIPNSYEIYERFKQDTPYPEPERIIRKVSVIKDQSFLDIDLWYRNGRDFNDWLNWIDSIEGFTNKSITKIVSSQLSAYAVSLNTTDFPAISVSYDAGDYFLRFKQKFTNSVDDYISFLNILKSLHRPDSEALIIGEQKDLLVRLTDQIQVNQELVRQGNVIFSADWCCGLYSLNNPYPCCDNPAKGNCTWHVYYRYGYVPMWGNAISWESQARATPGWATSAQPQAGIRNIGWQGGSALGHVAYIYPYNPAAGVTGDEQKYCVTGCPLYFSGRAVGYYPRYIYKTTDRPWESLTPYPEAD
ncbi:MAG: CHAP domain-containing protein [Anaerolineaceae bacterium]